MSKLPSGPAVAAPPSAEVIAGRYRIVSCLAPPGPGTLGTTYTAVDLAGGTAALTGQPGGQLTLRVLADHGGTGGAAGLGDEDRQRFEQQALRLSSVRHPAVAQTYELGLLPGLGAFLAREPVECEGQTLRDVLALRGAPLPEEEAIILCAQIGEALEVAHLHGACHLGLSPSCIYVYPDGSGVRLKVADFGLLPPAWAARLGEAGYLAPEQVDGQLGAYNCDRRTDQFALAVILYEMLAGQPAFIAAADEDRRIILGRVRNEDPLPLSQSRGVEQALARALSRSRAVRFPSVRDFVRALGADVSGWPVGGGLAAAGGPPGGGRSPRVFVPMAIGAVLSLLGLGGVVALRQLTQGPLSSGRLTGQADLADSVSVMSRPGPTPATPDPVQPVTDAPASPDGGARTDEKTTPAEAPLADGGSVDAALEPPDDRALRGHNPDLRRRPISTFGLRTGEPKFPPLRGAGTGSPGIQTGMSGANKDDVDSPSGGARPGLPALQFGGEASALTDEQRAQLTSCVRMIAPQPPFQVWLQNINGTLYVDPTRPSEQFSSSQDFRDCLKLSIKGKIVPKVLTITRMSKGKAAP